MTINYLVTHSGGFHADELLSSAVLTRAILDMSRFDAAPLIAFIAAKETDYGNETDGRIPG
jgi:uncharacterized UPF0160 family protein|tara:strand:+ start:111 stop:293 length:183 start_codon:yes stop_codon:yes gene_type:complete